jgi:DEAD/DEAH box helicase domain-containing protein
VLAALKRFPAQDARYADFPDDLDPRLRDVLVKRGVERPYAHQRAAHDVARAGGNTVVVTPTASGKTLCYNLPVLDTILKDPDARALYLFPTKALAQDQLAELYGLIEALGADIGTFTYDGDTPQDARKAIRARAHIVVTNPDMLHKGILPHHTKWVKLFENLRYVVVDELHSHRGVYGSHVANIFRRLHRLCEFYGSSPQILCSSATIGNPKELAEGLSGRAMTLVDQSGAPRGERFFAMYNPPVVNRQLGIRRSALGCARDVALSFLKKGLQTIVFAPSRLSTEVLVTYLKEALETRPGSEGVIRGYRGGYLPLRRREIERGLRDGSVLGVVSTNALELGIDIGSLQCAVLVGYPGTIASTWQQLGRAGRRSGSVGVFVASSSPLDQFIVRHPQYFLGTDPEEGLIDPDNLLLLAAHLQAGLFELPFMDEERLGRADVQELLRVFEEDGSATRSAGRWFWSRQAFPAEEVHLRRILADNVVIIDTSQPRPQVIGEMDQFTAPVLLHEEAVYLHEGAQYHVDRLDWNEKKAYVRPVQVDYYTDALASVTVQVLETFDFAEGEGLSRSHGEVKITSLASMFKKIRFHTHENIGAGPIHLPEQTLHTTGYWVTVDPALWASLGRESLEAGLQGMAHSLRHIASLRLMCDPRDLGAVAEVRSVTTQLPTVTVYEVYPGGVGFAARMYEVHRELLEDAAALVRACPCAAGCPSCIGPLHLVEGAKEACLRLLSASALPV